MSVWHAKMDCILFCGRPARRDAIERKHARINSLIVSVHLAFDPISMYRGFRSVFDPIMTYHGYRFVFNPIMIRHG